MLGAGILYYQTRLHWGHGGVFYLNAFTDDRLGTNSPKFIGQVMAVSDKKRRGTCSSQDLARYNFLPNISYAPGPAFIESLALWRLAFTTTDERRMASLFIKKLDLYLDRDAASLVDLAFPTVVRPVLIARRLAHDPITLLVNTSSRSGLAKALRQTLFCLIDVRAPTVSP